MPKYSLIIQTLQISHKDNKKRLDNLKGILDQYKRSRKNVQERVLGRPLLKL